MYLLKKINPDLRDYGWFVDVFAVAPPVQTALLLQLCQVDICAREQALFRQIPDHIQSISSTFAHLLLSIHWLEKPQQTKNSTQMNIIWESFSHLWTIFSHLKYTSVGMAALIHSLVRLTSGIRQWCLGVAAMKTTTKTVNPFSTAEAHSRMKLICWKRPHCPKKAVASS